MQVPMQNAFLIEHIKAITIRAQPQPLFLVLINTEDRYIVKNVQVIRCRIISPEFEPFLIMKIYAFIKSTDPNRMMIVEIHRVDMITAQAVFTAG